MNSIKAVTVIFLSVFALFYTSREIRISSRAFIPETNTVLYLQEGTDLDGLISHLEDVNVQFDEKELRWVASMLGWRNFSAGRYELTDSYSYRDLLPKVAMGLQDHTSITIHSGTTLERLISQLGQQVRADALQFAAVFTDSSSLVQELGYDPQTLFSRMLPDTYNVYWTSSPESIIRRIYQEFQNRIERDLSVDIAEHSMDFEELITLASIIEWEASFNSEKAAIGGLYLNRLNRNMRLQADPTVIYAIGEHRRLLFDDYQTEHPYNTYLIHGLPPGPITNPDISSLQAAINPEEHDYLYMVANPEGGHVFNRTFEEHKIASASWRRWLQSQVRIREELDRLENIGKQQTH